LEPGGEGLKGRSDEERRTEKPSGPLRMTLFSVTYPVGTLARVLKADIFLLGK
jgi:hypothetical protein